jgi:hypothetical protein
LKDNGCISPLAERRVFSVNIDERLALLAEKTRSSHPNGRIDASGATRLRKPHDAYSADVRDAIARLANITAAHDQRLDDQEKRIEKLES